MEIDEAIRRRRSIRRFKAPPTAGQLESLLSAAALAPSPMNRQMWDVVVVDDPRLLAEIARAKTEALGGLAGFGAESPSGRQLGAFMNSVLLVVYHRGEGTMERFDAGAGWLLVENICLAAVGESLAATVTAFSGEAERQVNELLRAPADRKLVCGLLVGSPDELPPPRQLRPRGEWVHWNGF